MCLSRIVIVSFFPPFLVKSKDGRGYYHDFCFLFSPPFLYFVFISFFYQQKSVDVEGLCDRLVAESERRLADVLRVTKSPASESLHQELVASAKKLRSAAKKREKAESFSNSFVQVISLKIGDESFSSFQKEPTFSPAAIPSLSPLSLSLIK